MTPERKALEALPAHVRDALNVVQEHYDVRLSDLLAALTAPQVGTEAVLSEVQIENALEHAAKAAFVQAQSVYRSDYDHFPLKNTWETAAESVREGWRKIAYAAVEAAQTPPLGTQPEPRRPRILSALVSPPASVTGDAIHNPEHGGTWSDGGKVFEADPVSAPVDGAVEALRDKIEGLTADLNSAVETAFERGAYEWTRLNYPEHYKRLALDIDTSDIPEPTTDELIADSADLLDEPSAQRVVTEAVQLPVRPEPEWPGHNPYRPSPERDAYSGVQMLEYGRACAEAQRALTAAIGTPGDLRTKGAFKHGDRVTKRSGSSWTGRVVGVYETGLTPIGYCVESENEPGSVQIYPEAALAAAPLPSAPEGGE